MHKYKNLNMRFISPYLFICYLATLIPIIELAQRKGNQIIPKSLLYKCMYLIILLLFYLYRYILPYTNFRALQPTLAYSTLWRPSGRGLQSTPLKQSKDPLEYHGVLLCFSLTRLRGISTTWSLSPLHLMFTKKHGVREG
jgi:hypothetical protein